MNDNDPRQPKFRIFGPEVPNYALLNEQQQDPLGTTEAVVTKAVRRKAAPQPGKTPAKTP